MSINPWFGNTPAIWSFAGILASFAFTIVSFLWLYFCYFPGGYKKAEVMDIGDYAMFTAQMKVEERKKQLDKDEEEGQREGEYPGQYDDLYHEHNASLDEDGSYPGTTPSHHTDIEGEPFYDGTASTPSSHPYSRAQTLEGHTEPSPGSQEISPSIRTATQEVSPSERASTRERDDRSETTYGYPASNY